MPSIDLAVIGGGIVGLATAYQFTRRWPGRRVVVLEKEDRVAAHQSGHNSGVLHTGIYYAPGSRRAQLCRDGKRLMEEFCAAEGIPFALRGKVIVAATDREVPAIERLHLRGRQNGVRCELIGPERLRELEPHAVGVRAVHVPEAGVVDYRLVCERLAECVNRAGGGVVYGARVTDLRHNSDGVTVETAQGEFAANIAVACAGLQADRVAQLTSEDPGFTIVPFRGEYYMLKPAASHLCRGLIYPPPDPRFPFLGVHLTHGIGGVVECGPNAVLALAREKYTRWGVDLEDVLDAINDSGFWRLATRHARYGLTELWQSLSKAAFVRTARRLVPELRAADLVPAPAGVRAQAVGRDGSLIDDFLIRDNGRVIHVCNAPSPAATASLAIGAWVVDRVAARQAVRSLD